MQRTDLQIQNKLGLHARPAAKLVELTQQFNCEIVLIKDDKQANAKSILSVMTLDIKANDLVTIEADGADEANAIEALFALAERNFDVPE